MTPISNPKPVKRAALVRAARKLIAACPRCSQRRPLSPKTGRCWPCDNLAPDAYPNGATDRQSCAQGEMCNDCAFRPESPEAAPKPEALLQIALPGDTARSPTRTLDVVIASARRASAPFWCHKPFLEPEQEWGYDVKSKTLTPLGGHHWRLCGGWCKVFDKHHGVAPTHNRSESTCTPKTN